MDTNLLLIVVAVYIVLNLIAFGMFVWDKKKAKNAEWRTPEKTLLTAALFGPFGALAGMKLAHHKTRKLKFKLVYVFVVLHIAILAYLAYRIFC
ncbi:MAG: DUF1294 domain-containing protein [Candidatus Methanomethylophilaceae archaeon]|nr:DUF1294 domain-containing protein [Candidatus Methanomethylophilaceae archaeon]